MFLKVKCSLPHAICLVPLTPSLKELWGSGLDEIQVRKCLAGVKGGGHWLLTCYSSKVRKLVQRECYTRREREQWKCSVPGTLPSWDETWAKRLMYITKRLGQDYQRRGKEADNSETQHHLDQPLHTPNMGYGRCIFGISLPLDDYGV